MASTKLKFQYSAEGSVPGSIYYLVNKKGKTCRIVTPFKVTPEEWSILSNNTEEITSSRLLFIRKQLNHDRLRLESIISLLEDSDTVAKKKEEVTLFSYMQDIIARKQRRGQERTSETYMATLNSFKSFRKGVDLYFSELNQELLFSYEYHLKNKGLSLNTVSFYMRRLRAVYRNAIEDGVADDINLFKKVYTSSEKTIKRAISLNHIRQIKNLDLSSSFLKGFARDMFLFSFYTRGMSFIDIFCLKKENLKNGVLTYKRRKTGQKLSMRWEPCMQMIADRYSSSSQQSLVISIKGDNARRECKNMQASINHHLKAIGRELGLEIPLTMYVARHSWASIARDNGIPIKIISSGMGHNSERTTQIYLTSIETKEVDKANSKIIKLI